MLVDLTKFSGQRIADVDELQVTQRVWIRYSDLGVLGAGLVAGFAVSAIVASVVARGQLWPYLLVFPVMGLVYFAFERKRSVQGEISERRFDKWKAKHKTLDGDFILPGSTEVFYPTGFTITLMHDYPIADDALQNKYRN